jgi:hypothetical protein
MSSKTMSTLSGAILCAALLTGCAVHETDSVSALPRFDTGGASSWLTGVWIATLWKFDSAHLQGVRRFTVSFAPDGTWTATDSADRRESGTASVVDGTVLIDGRMAGEGSPLEYTLEERGHHEVWGLIETSFRGRSAAAAFAMQRMPEGVGGPAARISLSRVPVPTLAPRFHHGRV